MCVRSRRGVELRIVESHRRTVLGERGWGCGLASNKTGTATTASGKMGDTNHPITKYASFIWETVCRNWKVMAPASFVSHLGSKRLSSIRSTFLWMPPWTSVMIVLPVLENLSNHIGEEEGGNMGSRNGLPFLEYRLWSMTFCRRYFALRIEVQPGSERRCTPLPQR